MNKFFITTAIPYVNADPHLGFTMELIQGDVLARYHRSQGDDTYFLNGSDENSLKNVQAAEKASMPVKEFVDQHVRKFKDLGVALNLSNDDFVRTTEERHVKSAQKLWSACEAAGDIYKKKYKGLYCVGCEEFKTKKELIDGLCPEHKTEPEEVEEENYFFKLSNYQDKLAELIDSGELKIIPETRKNEVREFIRGGLEDFSISRSVARAKGWGIPVPGDETQIMYVWFDALVNYISGLGYAGDGELFEKYWNNNPNRCHLIGKGITRFHAIYWPATLLSAGVKPPSVIYVHGYVNIDGEKISKSLGNTVDPFRMIEKYGADTVRYFLLREIPTYEDGDFSEKKLVDRYNGDLANGLGNLIQRIATLIESNLEGELVYNSSIVEKDLVDVVKIIQEKYDTSVSRFQLHEALASIWELIAETNTYINDKKPWALKENKEEFSFVITNCIFLIYRIEIMLRSFIPSTAKKIRDTFGAEEVISQIDGYRFAIKKGPGLFPRLEA